MSANLEKELREEIRITKIRKAILTTVAAAGIVTLAVMAPKVVELLNYPRKRRNERLRSALERLSEKGLVIITSNGIRLTAQGERFLYKNAKLPLSNSKLKWDHKWRIVIFDIPEKRKAFRNALRDKLQFFGFVRMQHSVWVYPYDCEELVTLLKTQYHLGKEVLYIIADKIERSSALEKHFNL